MSLKKFSEKDLDQIREAVQTAEKKTAGEIVTYFVAQSDEYEDLIGAGVIDPTKVTRSALENAASISGLLLTTQAVITDKPEEDKAPAMPPGGMPGGGMGGMY